MPLLMTTRFASVHRSGFVPPCAAVLYPHRNCWGRAPIKSFRNLLRAGQRPVRDSLFRSAISLFCEVRSVI